MIKREKICENFLLCWNGVVASKVEPCYSVNCNWYSWYSGLEIFNSKDVGFILQPKHCKIMFVFVFHNFLFLIMNLYYRYWVTFRQYLRSGMVLLVSLIDWSNYNYITSGAVSVNRRSISKKRRGSESRGVGTTQIKEDEFYQVSIEKFNGDNDFTL